MILRSKIKGENMVYSKEQYNGLYVLLVSIYVMSLVVTFATASKLVALPFGLSAAVGTIVGYAFSYVITDIISEFYGYKAAKHAVRCAFVCLFVALGLFQLSVWLPPAMGYEGQNSFAEVLGYPFRIILGGLLGYYISQRADIYIYHKIKHLTNGKHVWLRNNVSTIFAQLLDSIIWISVAFYGTVPNITDLIAGEYLVKVIIALMDTVIIYTILIILAGKIKQKLPEPKTA